MNTELMVDIGSITRVKSFVEKANEFICDIDVISGRYVIDGKSIMGVLSINILEPLKIKINSEDEEEIKKINKAMEEFKIED